MTFYMEAKMKQMARNPFLVFPLSVALAMALAVAWSLTQDDRLVINQVFLVFLLVIPLLAAGYSVIVRARVSWFRRILTWVGTTALGIIATFVVFFASGILIPYERISVYNYPHFHYSYYLEGAERRVTAGDEALEETLYTLEGNEVRLSDLWVERPIVVEFGSFT